MGGENCIALRLRLMHKLANLLLRFGSEGVLKIYSQRIPESMNQLINDEVVCKIAPATPGLLISLES